MNALPKAVFPRSLKEAEWVNSRLFREDPVAEVRRLKQEAGEGSLSLFGSSHLAADRHRLRLASARELASGVLSLSYSPIRQGGVQVGDPPSAVAHPEHHGATTHSRGLGPQVERSDGHVPQ